MGKHTQEPWKLYRNDQSVGDARGYAVCDVWPRGDDGMASEEGKANARRIVACVNACEGIDTDLLDKATSMRLDSVVATGSDLEEMLCEAESIVVSAIKCMRAAHVPCADLTARAENFMFSLAKAKGGAA